MRLFLLGCVLVCATTITHANPGAAFQDEDVLFRNGDVSIACTLSIPTGTSRAPAVVLLSGSGPQDRDSSLGEFRPFKLMAELFVGRGIAVLRCDDRGVGGSSGRIVDSTTEDFAGDALAAVHMLQARAEIDRARIGLLGHSEGAVVAAIAASRSADVGFVVWMAGPAISGGEILQAQAATLARAAGVTENDIRGIVEKHAALMKAISEDAPIETVKARAVTLAMAQLTAMPGQKPATPAELEQLVNQHLGVLRSSWMRFFVSFDPEAVLRRVGCPVFAVFGGRDLQVPAEVNKTRLATALEEAGNQNVSIRVFPSANHLFMPAVTGQPAEYSTLPKIFVESFLDEIAAWVLQR